MTPALSGMCFMWVRNHLSKESGMLFRIETRTVDINLYEVEARDGTKAMDMVLEGHPKAKHVEFIECEPQIYDIREE